MAKAGDGRPRSASRQRHKIIRVRVTTEEETCFCAAARLRGQSTAGFMRDAAKRQASGFSVPPWLIGELGMLGGALTALGELMEQTASPDGARAFRALSTRIARMQRRLMQGDGDAGGGDPAEARRGLC